MNKNIFIIILSLSISSCSLIISITGIELEYSEYFNLNDTNIGKEDIICCNLTEMGSIEREDGVENAIYINENGIVSLKNVKKTQFISDITVELLSGTGLEIYSRNKRDRFDNGIGVKIEFNKNGCRILENGIIVGEKTPKLEIGEKYRIIVKNEGDMIKVSIDCVDVFEYRTKIPSTEYLILASEGKSKLHISGIEFNNIYNKMSLERY